jgi:hypothetical protein
MRPGLFYFPALVNIWRVSLKITLVSVVAITLTPTAPAQDEKSIADLRNALIALSPKTVDPREAQLLSETAHRTSLQCARDYGVKGDPAVHNYLIHIGVKKKGICADYTHDIGARLRELRFRTLVLHWGTAWEKESDENNALIVTAVNQSFYDGIVLDGWRRAGRLFWVHVKDDAEYETGRHGFLGHLGGHARTYITAWKEDPQGTRSLQPPTLPVKLQPKRKASSRKN